MSVSGFLDVGAVTSNTDSGLLRPGCLAWSPVEERAVADRFELRCECQATFSDRVIEALDGDEAAFGERLVNESPEMIGRAGAVTEADRIAAALENVMARRCGYRACRSRPTSRKKSTATILAPHGRVLRWPLCPPISKTKRLGFGTASCGCGRSSDLRRTRAEACMREPIADAEVAALEARRRSPRV